MELTQDFDVEIIERIQRDRSLAVAILSEVDAELTEGKADVAQELLRLVAASSSQFEELKQELAEDVQTEKARLNVIATMLKRALGVPIS